VSAETRLVPPDSARVLSRATLIAIGAPEAIADAVSDHMIEANLVGYDSHGIHLLPVYVDDVRHGEIRPTMEPRLSWEAGAAALVSGERGFGQYTGVFAMNTAVRLAKAMGVGLVGIVHVHHLGRMGAYAEQAARQNCASMTFTAGLGGAVQAAPYGGRRSAYGANPVSLGFASEDGTHLVVDYATTVVAGGKVMLARTAGVQLPPGVLVDAAGNATTDPNKLFDGGALLPFGAHKGYGLALATELLGRVLPGSDTDPDSGSWGDRFGRAGATFIAIDQDVFRPAGDAAAAARETLEAVRAVPPADAETPVRTPGDSEAETKRVRLESGIPLPTATIDALSRAAEASGVNSDVIRAFTQSIR
jgi:hydroxycarboxylate dehydrogenase B